MNKIDKEIVNKLNNIEEVIYQNKCWVDLLRGYCKNAIDNNKEFENIIQPLKKLSENNQNLAFLSQDLSDYYFRTLLKINENK